jgi:cyclopropane-fatty-acyl-phospholipid synthase
VPDGLKDSFRHPKYWGEAVSPTTTSGVDQKLLAAVRRKLGPVPVALALRDTENLPDTSEPVFATIRIKDRSALMAMAVDPDVGFGEGFSAGRIDVEGDLIRTLETAYRASPKLHPVLTRLRSMWLTWSQANTRRGSSRNIHHHYDLSNDFYRMWLDERMVYTCAYFPSPEASLEAAQEAKLEMVCRKLRLQPGETVVEVGCGWGALAIYMAQHYGVRVQAYNISHEQISYAREWAKREGVTDRVEFIEDDYRTVNQKFDVFCSVGMLEHVGLQNYHELGNVIHRVIGDTGRGFLHFIGRNRAAPLNVWIRKRIFPGGYAPTVRESMEALEPQSFSVLDIENLRLHYAKTLEHWLARFESVFDTVVREKGMEFARMWRLYLAGSVAAFSTGKLQLFQVLFAGCHSQFAPLTREDLYTPFDQETSDQVWTRAM